MMQSQVTVFAFRMQQPDDDDFPQARFKATRHDIEQRYRGTVIEGTGEVVPTTELDEEGRFRRVATAWGELR